MSTFPGAFVPVAPPADGLRLAFVAARRRRNTKAGAAGASGLLAAMLVLATAGGSGDRTLLQEPLPPAHGGLGVVTGVAPAPAQTPALVRPAGDPRAPVLVASDRRAEPLAAAPARPAPLGQGNGRGRVQAAGLRTGSGPMSRDYSYSTGGGDLICPARKQQQGERGLCADLSAYQPSPGVTRVTAEICNYDTSAATLTYETARELDVTVRRGGKEVWRWSAGRSFEATPHALTLPVGECLMWSTDWTQSDHRGEPVAKGSYDVGVDFDAEQLPTADRHASYSTTIS
jgi:hypothetical protein